MSVAVDGRSELQLGSVRAVDFQRFVQIAPFVTRGVGRVDAHMCCLGLISFISVCSDFKRAQDDDLFAFRFFRLRLSGGNYETNEEQCS